MICYIPGCTCYGSENFGLGPPNDDYVGFAGADAQFYSVAPYGARDMNTPTDVRRKFNGFSFITFYRIISQISYSVLDSTNTFQIRPGILTSFKYLGKCDN